MTVRGWKVWYGPDDVYPSHDWAIAPDDGVQCVVVYFSDDDALGHPKRLVLSGDSFYFLAAELDHPVCSNDSPDEIHARYPGASIKRGKWLSSEDFTETMRRAHADEAP